ncbi:SufS family cysteine desulfurase [Pseudochelatococcus contaminans]|uniref:cysteine desulfurase n=1 Tax=Pseudochelatococcus contaminans TaxID=1538103 RepID=A0A7W5Z868_9HYPH|nr:SufS family cysteine desulfurase [Pseudochelatococcus contaminans]MBB3811367.1 cysteine desulfurase/selenocysteine lyase [Pseudochelatococcus contaminans]
MTTRHDPTPELPANPGEWQGSSLISQLVREAFSGFSSAPSATGVTDSVPRKVPSAPIPPLPRVDAIPASSSVLPPLWDPVSPYAVSHTDPVTQADPVAYVPESKFAPAYVPDRASYPLPSVDTFPFGEPRFTEGYEDRQNGDSAIAEHHTRLDSASNYYFLQQPEARQSDAVPPSVGPGASGKKAPASARVPAVETADNAPRDSVLTAFESRGVRRDFPALHQTVNGKPLIWLDNAATTQKPQSVIDITSSFYSRDNSNIHRAAHTLAARATDLFEGARDKLRDFIGAAHSREIVFLRGTTEAINLVANSFGQKFISSGDEILITEIEHHANIVPWQLLAKRTGAVLKVAPVDGNGTLLLDRFAALLGPRTKLVSVTQVANALGTINPIAEIIALSHARGVPVLVDAAQSAPHLPIDVRALDADFLVLSGHKIFGPTGIGILYAKEQWLEALPPWQGGGHMIKDVTFEHTVFQGPPEKFEAGTPDIAGAIGLGAAVDYINGVGIAEIAAFEHALLEYANEGLATVPGLRIIGTSPLKASVLSFVINGFEPDQVSRHLDKHGIATRSGHHCAQPALRHFGLETTVRASLAFYNTREDVDTFINALHLLPKR